MLNRNKGMIIALCLFTSLLVAGFVARGTLNTHSASVDAEFNSEVRSALSEIAFPAGGNASAVDTAAANPTYFFSYRAGVLVSDTNEQRISSAEQIAQTGRRISKSDLVSILSDIASDKLRNLTDSQRDHVVETLRGFDHADLPQSFRNGRDHVSIRASGEGRMTAEELAARLDSVRGENADSKLVRSLINNSIALEVESICSTLADADPGFFGDSKCDMTVLQALLVAYAVVTDDLLAGNQAQLTEKMQRIRQSISDRYAVTYPGPEGHAAYGVNGYIFSSPADLFLDDGTMAALISRIEEKLN